MVSLSKGRVRRRGAAVLVAAACAAAAVAPTPPQEGPPPLAAPGRLVDVGGWKLHLDCTGATTAGAPTVILEAGAGDFSVEWSLVQPGVAKFARVCSYDRAGDGWSEMGPFPRTYRQIVYELHTLLDRAGERGPFVLVGHSYGGWLVRAYQAAYPAEVAGLVLLDGGSDDPARMLPDGKVVHASDLAKGTPVPPVKTSGPLTIAEIPADALAAIRAGLAEASATANEPPRDLLPDGAKRMRTWALGRVEHVVAAQNPAENEELAALRAARLKSDHSLGDLPLVVIVRGVAEETGPDAAKREADRKADFARIAAASRRGRLLVAGKSGHHIQLQQPDLVISTIREMLGQANRPAAPVGQSR
jgi:pimeloyl-ACP methyl ester carboxylesterase